MICQYFSVINLSLPATSPSFPRPDHASARALVVVLETPILMRVPRTTTSLQDTPDPHHALLEGLDYERGPHPGPAGRTPCRPDSRRLRRLNPTPAQNHHSGPTRPSDRRRDLQSRAAPDDIIIDGGNALWSDTIRRKKDLTTKNLRFIGSGVSGGEEGARFDPSLMPGGAESSWNELAPIWSAIAAKVDATTGKPLEGAAPGKPVRGGVPCTTYIGPNGAGGLRHRGKCPHRGRRDSSHGESPPRVPCAVGGPQMKFAVKSKSVNTRD